MTFGSITTLAAAVLLGGSAIGRSAHAQTAAPLSVEAALAQPSFQSYSKITLSPDAQWVAYTLRYPNRNAGSTVEGWYTRTGAPSTAVGTRVRITEVRTGRTLIVGNDSATSWAPSWSPDGRYLAFYSDAGGLAHLWVRETASGRTRRVTKTLVRAHRAMQFPRWTPDSRQVVMPILPVGTSLPEARPALSSAALDSLRRGNSATVTVLRADPALPYGGQSKGDDRDTDVRESLHADLALVNVETGRVTTLAAGYWPLEYAVSANGRHVAFSSEHPPTMKPTWRVPYDLMVVALGNDKPEAPRAVARGVAITNYSTGVYWSPTSAILMYSATDSAGRTRYYAADSSTWAPREVATSGVAEIRADSIGSRRSYWWDESGRAFYIFAAHSIAIVSMPDGQVRSVARAPAGRDVLAPVESHAHEAVATGGGAFLRVAFRSDSTKRVGFARMDLVTSAWTVLREEGRHYGDKNELPNDVAADGRVVYLSEDAQHPADVWLASADFSSTRQITHVAPELERVAFGATRLIEYATPAGPRRATLLLPVGYRPGVRYPLVVYPYPVDPRSNDVNVFGITGPGVQNMQLLATRGFAVLAPDVAPFDFTDQMRELARIIVPAVDAVIALGVADSSRLGIMGHSWGGYTTLALIAQTPRFAAAVMRGGEGDQVATTGTLATSGWAYGIQIMEELLGGTLWERRENYLKNSPIYLLDQVHTPLLIIHGAAETTVPVFLAQQVFAGLQRLGRTVEFARYAHENHNESLWSYANQRDFALRMIGWFETHLKGERDARNVSAPGGR
ncbi:MAG: S9 family peptidase [Gemmatimonadaceae bacterium]